MTDFLLSIITPLSIWLDQILTMGLPVIQESMDRILDAMKDSPLKPTELVGMARSIGACCALGVGSYEAWMMILGRRGIDVMKILRIVIISCCISGSSWISKAAAEPGYQMEAVMRAHTKAINGKVAEKENEVAQKQKVYLDSLRSKLTQLELQKESDDKEDGGGLLDISLDKLETWAKQKIMSAAVISETKLAEFANDVIRFIGEMLFQMMFYGMLLGQRCFLAILGMFCPIAFAMSLAPPFKSAWSQWLSKYLSISLWGFVVYCVLYYVEFFIVYFLDNDLKAYDSLIHAKEMGSWDSIGALGLQALGTTCQYAIAMLIGFKVLSMVPEVASWLIPGGVSSSMGSAAAGMASAAGGAVGGAVGAAVSAPGAIMGAVQQAHGDGHSAMYGLATAAFGGSYSRAADKVRSVENVGTRDKNMTRGGKNTPNSGS